MTSKDETRRARPVPPTRLTLNRDYIATVALSLIDDIGLDKFSMRKLGTELGVDPMAVYRYFTDLTADRQAHPTDDLATLIANGIIDDAPMPDLEKMGYYVIIATAGHDTTAAAMAAAANAEPQRLKPRPLSVPFWRASLAGQPRAAVPTWASARFSLASSSAIPAPSVRVRAP